MSRQITQPVNQVRLTNVAVVRMNRCGKRFELACYRNKIVNYRQGVETDLSEVLQTTRVFSNVSKGAFAPSSALQQAFGTTDEDVVCARILREGKIQISDRERSAQLENSQREIATWVANHCVDPRSHRRYTTHTVLTAMKEAEFAVHPNRRIKQQFLDCVKLLKEKNVLPIERAKMRLCVLVDPSENDDHSDTIGDSDTVARHLQQVEELNTVIFTPMENDNTSNDIVDHNHRRICVQCLVDPSLYRVFDKFVKQKQGWRLEILQQCVFQEGEVKLEREMERKEILAQQQKQQQEQTHSLIQSKTHCLETKLTESLRLDNDDYDKNYDIPSTHSKKDQKKAPKKSKKAKRREKEDALDRQERLRAEMIRQETRRKQPPQPQTIPYQPITPASSKDSDPIGGGTNSSPADNNTKSCNTCGGSFTVAGYRSHFRSDWHRYNIKLKMKGVPVVSEEEFKMCDADAFFMDN